ncbi:MAG: cytochrome c1 [Xanthomonadaceae bacterium]|nr:cytochrome c1 [Xanthomonadaceae bacterium]
MIRKLAIAICVVLPVTVFAADPLVPLERANVDVTNRAALQRGAALFVNNCMGCHSAQYMRWNRVAADIGISEEMLAQYLQVTGERPGDQMRIAMPAADAEGWFGLAPPDLSLVTRSRGTDWVYSFLLTFYVDDTQPLGVNNLTFPMTGMPHALWEMQGLQRAVFSEPADGGVPTFDRFEQVTEGSVSPDEYRRAVRDITAFLAYVGEPVRAERQSLGMLVVFFLLVFFGFAYMLKREYWKDVH